MEGIQVLIDIVDYFIEIAKIASESRLERLCDT